MEKPIIFSTEMVQAILDGRKTMTRRVIKFPIGTTGRLPENGDRDYIFYPGGIKRPMYCPGDILYVREKFNDTETDTVLYAADKDFIDKGCKEVDDYLFMEDEIKWKPSIHMPKSLARIWLKVTDVRVERLQDINKTNHDDILKEGLIFIFSISPLKQFQELWDSLNAKRGYGWDINPWVWVIEFERVRKDAKMDGD